jgi:hypothetical protein
VRVENIRAIAAEGLVVVTGAVTIERPAFEARDDWEWFVGHDSVFSVFALTAE